MGTTPVSLTKAKPKPKHLIDNNLNIEPIDEEADHQKEQLSEQFSRMALNNKNNNNSSNSSDPYIRVIYKVNYSSKDSLVRLSVIPIKPTDRYRNGYQSNWNEVRQQVIDLTFKDRSEIPENLQFVAAIDSSGYYLDINTKDDYFTALKVAEICGLPLDVMIKKSASNGDLLEQTGEKESAVAMAAVSEPKLLSKQKSSDSDNDPTDERTGFVVLNTSPMTSDCSTQSSSGNLVVMSETEIEKLKKDITIDVTKRLISKLNECLIDLTNETPSDTPPVEPIKTTTTSNCGAEASGDGIPASKVVHRGIICDNCDLQIVGIRYKCVNCLDFDLCEKCKQKPNVHQSNHTFNKIERYIRGIPKQTYSPNLDFLRPFLSGATVDPQTRDMYLALDVDLNNGTVSKSNACQTNQFSSSNVSSTATPKENQKNKQMSANKLNSEEESTQEPDHGINFNISSTTAHKKYICEKKANKITKKLEKLKLKSQMYNNMLENSDEQSSASRKPNQADFYYHAFHPKDTKSQPSATVSNPALNSNKTLYLSGLLVSDETIPEGTRMPPNTKFRKTWKLRNTGTKVWSGRTTLRFVWGHSELEPFGRVTEVPAPTLRPGEDGRVTVRFTSPNPSTVTRYQSYWRLHHRGQPFGQRMVVKVIVDPSATSITPMPAPLVPIISKDVRNATLPRTEPNRKVPVPRIALEQISAQSTPMMVPNYPKGKTCTINDTKCNLEAMGRIHQSILDSQRTLSERLRAMAAVKQTSVKVQKTSAKRLTEALHNMKEIRFNLDENETIPMKSNVKSHTTTPANTPFDVSPPKSPEPNSHSNNFTQNDSNDKNEKTDSVDKQQDKQIEDKDQELYESDGESLDVLSLSSGNESSDEFVLVPLPSCFDLNVPFVGIDNKGFEDSINEKTVENKPNDNCFEVIDENKTSNEDTNESDDNNTDSSDDSGVQNTTESTSEAPLDLTKDKQPTIDLLTQSLPSESTIKTSEVLAEEPPVKPKNPTPNASTNPFRENTNDTENVIHVLPESIVTGALSAAAHVYNNVSRALFSRNEGTNFAWVTSPPPAALPLPDMYWENRSRIWGPNREYPPLTTTADLGQNQFLNWDPVINGAPTEDTSNEEEPSDARLANALKQLQEMGFWNKKLNHELLQKNGYDVNDAIEQLLSPNKGLQQTTGTNTMSEEPVVSHQPRNKNGFIDEFD